jgi:hypothetical protein
MARRGLLLLVAGAALTFAGCVRGCTSSRAPIHLNPNMDWQPKYGPQEPSEFFYDGKAMRTPVAGTVARGGLAEDEALATGRDGAGQLLARSPLPESDALLARGAQRYTIYCQPCHEKRGTGRGILFQRGRAPTPSFHEERLRGLPDGDLFQTITQGKGLMPAYGYPIPPADRWAIIAHVRRLQREHQETQLAGEVGR